MASKRDKGHIVVLLGGESAEREVSLVSGRACIEALRAKGYRVTGLDPRGALGDLRNFVDSLLACKADKVFNALHGCPGEDGVFQAILDWLDIPYTHSGLAASAAAMHKGLARSVFSAAGLPVADGFLCSASSLLERFRSGGSGELGELGGSGESGGSGGFLFRRPFVLKPVREGSSVGVHIIGVGGVENEDVEKILSDWRHGDVLVEEYIAGKELTVSVMGDRALAVTDLFPSGGFYDFAAKYTEGWTRHVCPAEISSELRDLCLDYALRAHMALGCGGISRSDFRYDVERDRLIILEVNTQPGMTPLSLVPEQARHCGIGFEDLCEWIVEANI